MAHRRAVRRRQLRTGRRWNERDPDRPGQDNHRRNRRRHLQWLPGAHRPRGPRAATQKSLPGPVPVTRDAPCARPKSGLRPTPSPSLPRTSNPSSRRAGGFSRHVAARWSGDAAKGSPSVIGMRPLRAVRAVFAPPHRRGFSNHVLPGGVAMPQRGAPQFGPLCLAAGRGPSDRASFIQRGESGRVVPPGRCGFAMVRRSGGATARPLESIWASLPHDFIQRGESERAVWCLPGGADLPWCAAAGAQLPGHWIRFGASLPHGRRRERPVGPGQFHSERRIRAGRVVPPGRCGFAMVRRSGGATARPLDSIWSLSAAWSAPGEARRTGPISFREANQSGPCGAGRVVPPGRCGFAMVRRSGGATARPLDSIWSLSAAWSAPGEARRTGPVSFREANQSGPCGASRAVRICHGAPQQGRNCPATGFDLEPLCRMVAIVKHWPNRRPTTKITDWN